MAIDFHHVSPHHAVQHQSHVSCHHAMRNSQRLTWFLGPIEILKLSYLQIHSCPQCRLWVWVCEMRQLAASIAHRNKASLGECTCALAFPDRLFRPPPNGCYEICNGNCPRRLYPWVKCIDTFCPGLTCALYKVETSACNKRETLFLSQPNWVIKLASEVANVMTFKSAKVMHQVRHVYITSRPRRGISKRRSTSKNY